jgi:predicted ATP-dependent endonuclease of OLD family
VRLVKAEVRGFGRLADGKVNLDSKVVAVVGPNEAGKTTLLKALAYVDNGNVLAPFERSRGMDVADDAVVVRVQYLLDDDDRAEVDDYDLEEAPRSLWISRTAGTGATHLSVVPSPRKAVAPLAKALSGLKRIATTRAFAELTYVHPEPDEDGNVEPADEVRASLKDRTEQAVNGLAADAESEGAVAATGRRADELRAVEADLVAYGIAPGISGAIRAVLDWQDRADPTDGVASDLHGLSPDILLFGDADRTLASSHALSDQLVATPPASLHNLLGMAELDLKKLWVTFTTGDEGERETLVDSANRTLAAKFKKAWNQSDISVVLKTEGAVLAIRIRQNGTRITQFDERSAGLKMFVALVAFLEVRGQTTPPVLLIDEAETHLHIDAQADLVNTFMTQRQAAKIIYTTHSPACLPPDLGSNIRAVVPDPDHEYRSLIKGSFWDGAAGFSPLMLAMGAGAAAFSTARYVVLAEGASEMLVLPSLIKRAVGAEDLEYQVAPGLSEVAPEMYPELDLAGARVAYLVDGDQGGHDRRDALIAGGVPEDRIVVLGALTLENLLDPAAYAEAFAKLLAECNPDIAPPDLPDLPEPTAEVWPRHLERWSEEHGLKAPGKRIVASRLVEEGLARPSDYGASVLRAAHDQLRSVLGRATSGMSQ